MKEIIILSGKGGTGKTTVIGSLAMLAQNTILADCDVDAADLHLLLSPTQLQKNEFRSGVKARVITDQCTGCGTCFDLCQFESITMNTTAHISRLGCEGCGVCADFCPEQAIALDENHCGYWYISETEYGKLVHADLFAGEENSGKLVSFVKSQARELAEKNSAELILVDGAPGIGCPVIASLSNSDAIVAVTEPTLSGWHDLERVLDLAVHFKLQSYVCINKFDLNAEISRKITDSCTKRGIDVLGTIPFDRAVVTSQLNGIPVVADDSSPAGHEIRKIWNKLKICIEQLENRDTAITIDHI